MTAQGKANYEAWRKAGGWQGSAYDDLEYDDLGAAEQRAFDAGADAVEQWVAGAPVDEDMPGGEPKVTTVIVVTEAGGRERRYAANDWNADGNGSLLVLNNGDLDTREALCARYAPGAWLSVRFDGVEVPDSTAKALGIAKQALAEIIRRADNGGQQPLGRPEIAYLASTALNDIWTETEG